jgi:transposase
MSQRRYELTDFEWSIIEPLLPNKPRGVPRADDRKVLNGIYWRLRTGSPWADIPERYGPATTCYNRFVRWRKRVCGIASSRPSRPPTRAICR